MSKVEDLKTLSWKLESLVVGVGCCNGFNNSVSFERFSLLKSLVIGDNCFQFVKELRLIGFQELVSVKIGCQCFATSTYYMNGDSRCDFYLKNCPKLQYLTIDGFSFANASVFEIENVDALEEIDMGDVDEESINFQDASLLLKSA